MVQINHIPLSVDGSGVENKGQQLVRGSRNQQRHLIVGVWCHWSAESRLPFVAAARGACNELVMKPNVTWRETQDGFEVLEDSVPNRC